MRPARQVPKMKIAYVKHYGQVGAGRPVDNVVPFMPRSELVPIAIPENIATANDNVGLLEVCGVSLEDLGIYDGDQIVFKRQFSWREITEDRVCVVFIHATSETVAKRIVKGANMLILRASGGNIKDLHFAPEEIEIQGIVIGHQRLCDPVTGSFERGKRSSINSAPRRPVRQRFCEDDFPF